MDRRSLDPDAPVVLSAVSKRWGDRIALDDVDLELAAGTAIGVVGGNGVGKTTLLRIASGVIIPDGGTVRFRGVDIEADRSAYRQSLGYLSAGDRGLYARLTVRQNLDFWGSLAGLARERRRRRAVEVLSEFDIEGLADNRVDRLSMGQRQRVRLAMALLHEPRILFLDEPETSLDRAGISLLSRVLERFVHQGGAVLVASPDPNQALINRAWVLEQGRLRRFDRETTSDRRGMRPANLAEEVVHL